ncbi:hypothetical protein TNCV_2189441 [Trichonephila clavipes]|nr:hypothetical protein TNCV_2189441 [Trichonephila clavipes]
MASVECMGGSRALTPHCSAGCSVNRQYMRTRGCGSKIQYHAASNHDTGCRTSVSMDNATVEQTLTMVSPN